MLFKTLTVSTRIVENAEETLTSALTDYGLKIHSIDYEKNLPTGELIFIFDVSTRNKGIIKEMYQNLGSLELVRKIKVTQMMVP